MKKQIVLSLLLAFTVLVGKTQTNTIKPTLSIGDPAPILEVHKWLKGTPVKAFEKGKVYVVECWATWCVPCIAAMPHLSELAQQYRDKVTVIGVSVWEGGSKPVPDVTTLQSFVDKKGKDMDYTVAMDDPTKNKFAGTWLKAADIKGIPATFVIDREGKIAWMGHPLKVDSILKQIVEKPETFDLVRTKEEYNKELAIQSKRQAVQSILGYGMSKNHGLAFQQAQKLIKEDPQFETENLWVMVRTYLDLNGKLAQTYVEGKLKDTEFLKSLNGGKGITNEEFLDVFAKLVAQKQGLDIDMYYQAVGRLNKVVQKDPEDYLTWSMLAQAYTYLNEPSKAILAQEKAITAFQNDIKIKPKDDYQTKALEGMTKKLEEYKKLKEQKDLFLK